MEILGLIFEILILLFAGFVYRITKTKEKEDKSFSNKLLKYFSLIVIILMLVSFVLRFK